VRLQPTTADCTAGRPACQVFYTGGYVGKGGGEGCRGSLVKFLQSPLGTPHPYRGAQARAQACASSCALLGERWDRIRSSFPSMEKLDARARARVRTPVRVRGRGWVVDGVRWRK
jgi:hypothetical protein